MEQEFWGTGNRLRQREPVANRYDASQDIAAPSTSQREPLPKLVPEFKHQWVGYEPEKLVTQFKHLWVEYRAAEPLDCVRLDTEIIREASQTPLGEGMIRNPPRRR
jgi:hypothetical protein